MTTTTKQFDQYFQKARRIYAELEGLPPRDRIAIVNLVESMCEHQYALEQDALEEEGDEWKKGGVASDEDADAE